MLKKWLVSCICILSVWTGAVNAREINFQLQSASGTVTEKSYPGKYLLLTLGYTTCPDICPATLYEFALAMRAIKQPAAIQPVFVTIDPVNDDPARLAAYTRFFDERIVGLTGDISHIEALVKQLGATFGYRLAGKKIRQPEKGTGYSVYHSSLIYLIGPDRKLLDVYDYQIGAEGLANALNKVLDGKKKVATTTPTSASAPAHSPDHHSQATTTTNRPCALPSGFTAVKKGLALQDILPKADMPSAKRVTLLNIWALWCAPCRIELPLLDRLAASQHNMAVQTLNLGDKPAAIAALFHKMNLQHLSQTSDHSGSLLSRLGARGLPYSALFVDGQQIAAKTGVINQTDALAAYAQCMQQHTH